MGARLDVDWQSATLVEGVPNPALGQTSDLRFSDTGTVDLTVFANVADQFPANNVPAWLSSVRVNLGIQNVLNQPQRVRDIGGLTPIDLQPAFLDPAGRQILLTIRKRF